jgi:AraC-like DNA-binding protein
MSTARDDLRCIYQPPNLALSAAGVAWPHSPAHWRPAHFHREPELNLVRSGRASYRLDTGQVQVEAGDLLWFPPYAAHELCAASSDFDMWSVTLDPSFVDRLCAERRLSRELLDTRSGVVHVEQQGLAAANGAFRHVFELACRGHLPAPELLARALSSLNVRAPRAERLLHPAARRARSLLRREPRVTRSELSRRLGVSESTLAHVFRRDLGVSLDVFRNRARLGLLLELLDDGEPSLSAGLGAGFGSAAQFHRAVLSLTGHRPGELRREEVRRALSERVRPALAHSSEAK